MKCFTIHVSLSMETTFGIATHFYVDNMLIKNTLTNVPYEMVQNKIRKNVSVSLWIITVPLIGISTENNCIKIKRNIQIYKLNS